MQGSLFKPYQAEDIELVNLRNLYKKFILILL